MVSLLVFSVLCVIFVGFPDKCVVSVQPFKSHICATAGALFDLNAYCGTMFSVLGERDTHLIGQCCPICPLHVNVGSETGMRPSVSDIPKVLLHKNDPLSQS